MIGSASQVVLTEEADAAYKDVNRVVKVGDKVGVATKVVQLIPLAVVKG